MVSFSRNSEYPVAVEPARLLAVCVSPGGIPKLPLDEGHVTTSGIQGDGRNHAKHIRPDRALSIWDYEILQQFTADGFDLSPGAAGENLTVVGLNVQQMLPGTLLRIGHVVVRLEKPRKPCYVLDAIDPRLKEVIVGRCGYMASVIREGMIRPGMSVEVIVPNSVTDCPTPPFADIESSPGAVPFHMMAGLAVG